MAQTPEAFDRRGFLKGLIVLSAAGAAYDACQIIETLANLSSQAATVEPTPEPTPTPQPKVAYAVTETPTPQPTPRPTPEPTPTKRIETFKKEVVSGIDVYRVKDKAEHEALNAYFKTQFEQRHGLTLSADPETRFRQVREKLDPKTRFLQLGVSENLYTKFKAEAKTTGIDLPTWLKLHLEEMNNIIARLDPPTKLRAELLRIVVYNEKAFKYNQESGILGIDYPVDIDAWFEVWTDLRGIIDPKFDPKTKKILKSDYLAPKVVAGRTVILDYGLIHELFHQLFNVPDEYMMDVTSGNPSLELIGDNLEKNFRFLLDTATRRTPFIAWYLREMEKLNIRGYYRDERSMVIAGDQEGQNSVEDIFGLRPKKYHSVFGRF